MFLRCAPPAFNTTSDLVSSRAGTRTRHADCPVPADHGNGDIVNQVELDRLCVHTLRFLAVDMVQNAKSGHPGMPLDAAGPLGQGVANAVGMAIGDAQLAARYSRPGHEVFDHFTYALAGDGDMMDGVRAQAASLPGHPKLGKLIVHYDSNGVALRVISAMRFEFGGHEEKHS
jgi:transketolase